MKLPIIITSTLCILLVLTGAAPAAPPQPVVGPSNVQPGGDHPGGAWDGLPVQAAVRAPERQWSLRTGLRKGIYDQLLDEEISAAPDVAVLKSGFYPAWTGLLAEVRESAVIAEPDRIAGLAPTTPVLVIPSGGLAGLASSEFFRAGLAEYVRTGGVVLCFSQQRGADLSALPVPSGSMIAGAGWSEDSGPLFRASLAQTMHPILLGVQLPLPSLETDGYLAAYPPGSAVLLARTDGYPTLVLYPFGKGWVAVTALFSEYSSSQGLLDNDERTLVRNLVLWAKSGGRMAAVRAGARIAAQVTVAGPEQGTASAMRLQVVENATAKTRDDRTFPLQAKALEAASLPYSFDIPADMQPGIFHLEYAWMDGKGHQLTPLAESGEGWFAVMPSSAQTATIPRADQPLAPLPARFAAAPVAEHRGDSTRLNIVVRRESGASGTFDLFARGAGQERYFKITGDTATVSLDIPREAAGRPVSYAVYHAGGRSLARGGLSAAPPARTGVSIDRPWYRPGQTLRVLVAGMGLGAFSATGLGAEYREHISKDKTYEIPVPRSLPSGVYSLTWDFQTRTGAVQTGEIPFIVSGTTITCTGMAVMQDAARGSAQFRITSTDSIAARMNLRLISPAGNALPDTRTEVALSAGSQDVSVPFSLPRSPGGIWQIVYDLEAALPDGPGFPRQPVSLSSGRLLVDAGPVAVLDMRTDRPVYYETTGTPSVTAVLSARKQTQCTLELDGKRLKTAKIDAAGTGTVQAALDALAQGPHSIRAAAGGGDGESSRELSLLFGARLPDLAVNIRTAGFRGPILEIGVGIMNQGKVASQPVQASLFEGEPKEGGALIQSFSVPPLHPGGQHVVIVSWPLERKAGLRKLVGTVESGGAMGELSMANNSAVLSLQVPDVLLTVNPGQSVYSSDEEPSYDITLTNYSSNSIRPLSVEIRVTDPSGRPVASETVSVPDFAPGASQRFSLPLALTAPVDGTYIIAAQASSDRPLASDSTGVTILPTLLLKGSLEETPAVAVPCRPFTIRYDVRNAGNVKPAKGKLALEIYAREKGQLVFSREVPFALRPGTVTLGKIGLPQGDYTIVLRGSAESEEEKNKGDFLLAERPLTVSLPVEAKQLPADFPRVLVWAGLEGASAIDRALTEKILKEAFDREEVYLTVVTSAGEFVNESLTGVYTTYVLLNADSILDATDVLRNGLAAGNGVLIAGSNDRSLAIGEALGFRFGPARTASGTSISIPAGTVPGIAGTVPLSGEVFPPEKNGARPVAVYAEDRKPAILLDDTAGGAVMIMPFSFAQSALHTGVSGMYAVLLRAAVQAVAPANTGQGRIGAGHLQLSSPADPVKARAVITLPAKAKFLWTSVPGEGRGETASFDITAAAAPQTILYLYRLLGDDRKTTTEILYECEGKFVSQGTVE